MGEARFLTGTGFWRRARGRFEELESGEVGWVIPAFFFFAGYRIGSWIGRSELVRVFAWTPAEFVRDVDLR